MSDEEKPARERTRTLVVEKSGVRPAPAAPADGGAEPPAGDPALPALEGYRSLRILGEGGQGVVVKALQLGLERDVVLKFLLPEYVGQGAMRERFFREALLTSKLAHPNIVKVLAVDEPRGAIVYEFVAGATLGAKLAREGPLEPLDAVSCCQQAAAGLVEAHKQGILHRDIKPDNLLVTADGTVKVLDFGLGRSSAPGPGQATQAGTILGTPGYMPPEQARGEAVGPAADIHALGATLFELLTGRRPYEGDDAISILKAIFKGPPPPLQSLRGGLPAAVCAVVDKSLRPAASERHRDMAEMERALGRCAKFVAAAPAPIDRRTVSMKMPSASKTMVSARMAAAKSGTLKSAAVAPPPAKPSSRGPAIALALVVALAAGAGLFLVTRAADSPASGQPSRSEGSRAGVSPVLAREAGQPSPSGSPDAPPSDAPPPLAASTPVPPGTEVAIAPPSEKALNVALACGIDRSLAGWVTGSGAIAWASSGDGGRTWPRWAPDARLRAAPRGDLQVAKASGRVYAAWVEPGSGGGHRVRLSWCATPATTFVAPVDLGDAAAAESEIALTARQASDGSVKLLAAWERGSRTADSGRGLFSVAWLSKDGTILSTAAVLPGGRQYAIRAQTSRPRVAILDSTGYVVYEDRAPTDRKEKALYVIESAGPGKPWSAPRVMELKSGGRGPEFPALAFHGDRRLLQWTEAEAEGSIALGPFALGRYTVVGFCGNPGLTVRGSVRIWKLRGSHSMLNALGVHGRRLWSTWHEELAGTNVWASSTDEGRSWSDVKQLCAYKANWRAPALDVTPAGQCWVVWSGEAGGVTAVQLP